MSLSLKNGGSSAEYSPQAREAAWPPLPQELSHSHPPKEGSE